MLERRIINVGPLRDVDVRDTFEKLGAKFVAVYRQQCQSGETLDWIHHLDDITIKTHLYEQRKEGYEGSNPPYKSLVYLYNNRGRRLGNVERKIRKNLRLPLCRID